MPTDLPAELTVPTRDEEVARYKRDYSLRAPGADTSPGTQPDIDAKTFADQYVPIGQAALVIAANVPRSSKTGQALTNEAVALGTNRLPAIGASGAVAIATAAGGTTIQQGDTLRDLGNTGFTFRCAATATYSSTTPVPITGVDTGPLTDLDAGTILTWTNPRPGCSDTATVLEQADGSGLSGGQDEEDDPELLQRLDYLAANPPAAGNDSQYQQAVLTCPGFTAQIAFTYPSIRGPGTTAIAFLLRPSVSGGNRIPNPTQIAAVAAWLRSQFPADDVPLVSLVLGSPITVVLKALWAQGAEGWEDAVPWPPYQASPNLVSCQAPTTGVTSATYFRLYAPGMTAPQVGQNIAFFDAPNLLFRQKRILSVAVDGAGGFDLTVDTTGGISDTSYTPLVGQPCCPWSDSLDLLVPTITAYFDQMGTGEMVATFFDPGLRKRRSPPSPQFWPSVIGNRILGQAPPPAAPPPPTGTTSGPQVQQPSLFMLSALQDVVLVEPAPPFPTPVGVPGVAVNLLTLGSLLAFPE